MQATFYIATHWYNDCIAWSNERLQGNWATFNRDANRCRLAEAEGWWATRLEAPACSQHVKGLSKPKHQSLFSIGCALVVAKAQTTTKLNAVDVSHTL